MFSRYLRGSGNPLGALGPIINAVYFGRSQKGYIELLCIGEENQMVPSEARRSPITGITDVSYLVGAGNLT